jgi:hypothetical protein
VLSLLEAFVAGLLREQAYLDCRGLEKLIVVVDEEGKLGSMGKRLLLIRIPSSWLLHLNTLGMLRSCRFL